MKILLPVVLASGLLLGACGSSGDTETAKQAQAPLFAPASGAFGEVSGNRDGSKLSVDPPDHRPPGKSVTRDVEVGSGKVARRGDKIAIYYVGIDYGTGKLLTRRFAPEQPLRFPLRSGGWGKDWEAGIEGMRVGGFREIIVPEEFGPTSVDYVVKLVEVGS